MLLRILSKNIFNKLILAIFTYLTVQLYSQKCKKYICGDLPDNLCLNVNNSTSPDTITGKLCKDNSQLCPSFLLESEGKASCQQNTRTTPKQYPGGQCNNDSDCIFGQCINTICLGVSDGEICDKQNCYYNRACYSSTANSTKTCNQLRKANDPCSEEYECPFNYGCFQGFCRSYFSFYDDADVSSKNKNNFYSFCKSGFDLNGICTTMLSLDENNKVTDNFVKCSPDNKCNYMLGNGTIISKTDYCNDCGKSKDGFVYCPVFGGKLYTRYVDYINSTFNNQTYYSNCNTIERKGICNFHLKNINETKERIETISTYEARMRFSQEFANAEDCIIQIFNTNFNPKIDNPVGPVPVDEKKCPVFQCDSNDNTKDKICTKANLDLVMKRLNISLFTKSCSWGKEICDFKKSYDSADNSKCIEKPNISKGKMFPGEPCNDDDDCYAVEKTGVIGFCANKTKLCLGKAQGEACGSTEQCLKGLYCKKGDLKSTCETQLGKDAKNCTSSYDCANNLACVNSTCRDAFYSLDLGDSTTDYDSIISPKYFCKTRITLNGTDGVVRCATMNHTDTKDTTEEDLVRCNFDQKCNYTISDNVNHKSFQLDCECGYNKNGQGYCKRGHDSSISFSCFSF